LARDQTEATIAGDTPITLGAAAKTTARLIVWCKACHHETATDPAVAAARYGRELGIIEWRKRLVCSRCHGRGIEVLFIGRRRNRH
jgi:hypothetical protein